MINAHEARLFLRWEDDSTALTRREKKEIFSVIQREGGYPDVEKIVTPVLEQSPKYSHFLTKRDKTEVTDTMITPAPSTTPQTQAEVEALSRARTMGAAAGTISTLSWGHLREETKNILRADALNTARQLTTTDRDFKQTADKISKTQDEARAIVELAGQIGVIGVVGAKTANLGTLTDVATMTLMEGAYKPTKEQVLKAVRDPRKPDWMSPELAARATNAGLIGALVLVPRAIGTAISKKLASKGFSATELMAEQSKATRLFEEAAEASTKSKDVRKTIISKHKERLPKNIEITPDGVNINADMPNPAPFPSEKVMANKGLDEALSILESDDGIRALKTGNVEAKKTLNALDDRIIARYDDAAKPPTERKRLINASRRVKRLNRAVSVGEEEQANLTKQVELDGLRKTIAWLDNPNGRTALKEGDETARSLYEASEQAAVKLGDQPSQKRLDGLREFIQGKPRESRAIWGGVRNISKRNPTPEEMKAAHSHYRSMIKPLGAKEKGLPIKEKIHNAYVQWVEKEHSLSRAQKELGGKFYDRMRLVRGLPGRVMSHIEKGIGEYVETGEKVKWWDRWFSGKSAVQWNKKVEALQDIVLPLGDDAERFFDYGVAKRVIEKEAQGIRTGFNIEHSKNIIANIENNAELYSKFQKAMEPIQAWQDHPIKELINAGVFDVETANKFRDMNRIYFPFRRYFDLTMKGKGGAGKGVKEMKGSARPILNPLESMIENHFSLLRVAELNKIKLGLLEAGEGSRWIERLTPEPSAYREFMQGKAAASREARRVLGDKVVDTEKLRSVAKRGGFDLSEIADEDLVSFEAATRASKDMGSTTVVYENGIPSVVQLDPWLAKAFEVSDPGDLNTLVKVLAAPAKLFRVSATTASPDFPLRNFFRDAQQAPVFSKHGMIPIIDPLNGIVHAIKKTDTYWDWLRSGGANANIVSADRNYLKKGLETATQAQAERFLRGAINPVKMYGLMQDFSELLESGSRLGEFAIKRGKAKTVDDLLQAALDSRDITLDFSRMGTVGQQMNRYTAFFNAHVQGIDKIVRNLRNHPIRTTGMGLTTLTAPALYLQYKNLQDDHPFGYVHGIPQWEKDLFWHFRGKDDPDGTPFYYKLPKPHGSMLLFTLPVERYMQHMKNGRPDDLERFAKDAIVKVFGTSFVPTALYPILTAWANKDAFRNMPIEPEHERKRYLPADRYGRGTSAFAKATGQLWGLRDHVSPRMIDHFGFGYFAGVARTFVDLTNVLFEAFGGEMAKPDRRLVDNIPIIRAFVAKQRRMGTDRLGKFYDDTDKMYQAWGSLMKAAGLEGGVKEPVRVGDPKEKLMESIIKRHSNILIGEKVKGDIDPWEYFQKTRDRVAWMNDTYKKLSAIRRQAEAIMDEKDLTPEVKKERLNKLYLQANKFAEDFENNTIEIVQE